jgi:hypothetical protein
LTDIEGPMYDTTTSDCKAGGEIGSIVLVPPEDAEKNAPFAVKVVASLGAPLENCVAPDYGPSCIVARRAMRFVPQRPFHVPVRLSQACAGVVCPETQTCVDGTCRSVTVDADDCDVGDTCVPDPVDVPPWQKPITGTGLQMARHVAVGLDNSVVLTGIFGASVALGGETFVSKGSTDVFVAAYSPAGSHKWSRAFGGPSLDDVPRAAIGVDGSIALAIQYHDTIDLGGGPLSSAGASDVTLAKFTAYGKLEWALPIGGPGGDTPSAVAFDKAGNLFVVGQFSTGISVAGETITSTGESDLFLFSFTRSGTLRWAKNMGGAAEDGGNAVAIDGDGHVYVTGYFSQTMNLTPTTKVTAVSQSSDAFVVSYDTLGEFRWIKTLASDANDRLMDVTVRGDQVVVTGRLSGQGRIGDTPVGGISDDGVVASFDTSGVLQWARSFETTLGGSGESVVIAADGAVVLGGQVGTSAVFGSEIPALPGWLHPFVTVLERDGKTRWSKVFSSSQYANTGSVAVAADDFVYITGWYVGGFDTGTGMLTGGDAEEGFLLRIAAP